MKYTTTEIVMREFPDEITLAINISGCPNLCEGCHSPELRRDIGQPLDYNVVEAPTGKPHMEPSTTAEHPAPDRPNSHRMGLERSLPSASPAPLCTKSSEMTKKGNREGMTVWAHRVSPRPIYSMAASEFLRMSRRQKMLMMQKKT